MNTPKIMQEIFPDFWIQTHEVLRVMVSVNDEKLHWRFQFGANVDGSGDNLLVKRALW